MKILKCKINTKKTKVKPIITNLPASLVKDLKKFSHMGETYRSEFDDYKKAKKLIFKFALDERNKTIRSIDQYSQYWHGIFKTEKLEFKKEYSSKNENIYGSKTSTWYGIGGMYATILYQYIITVSSTNGGLRISPFVYIAHPHKAGKDPKFKLCDRYDIVMDCIYSKEEALSFTTGLDDKVIKKIMNKSNMKKALEVLSKKPKKSKEFFSRRMQKYERFFQFDEKYDLIKLAKYLNEIVYDLLQKNEDVSISAKFVFKKFVVQFYQLYAIHKKITFAQALLEILEILKLTGNKNIEDIKYPVEPTESINQH